MNAQKTIHSAATLTALFKQIRHRRLGMWGSPTAEETAALMFGRTKSLDKAYAEAIETGGPDIRGFWLEVAEVLQAAREAAG